MKKLVSILMIAGLATAMVACGPSKKEKEEEAARLEQVRQDSIKAAEEEAARLAAEAEAAALEQARLDSIAKAEAEAAAAAAAKATKPAKKKTEPVVKAGQGRG